LYRRAHIRHAQTGLGLGDHGLLQGLRDLAHVGNAAQGRLRIGDVEGARMGPQMQQGDAPTR